jgi:hypothetical protein
MIQIQINGIEKLQRFMAELPIQLNKEIMSKSEDFMRFVQKSARLRAPRDTQTLVQNINVIRVGNEIILDTGETPYAYFQEFGFRPHWIHTDQITGSNKFSQIYGEGRRFIFVSKSKPFLMPALESGIKNLPLMLQNGLKNAIQQARK